MHLQYVSTNRETDYEEGKIFLTSFISVTALTKGQRIEIISNGESDVINRKDGKPFLNKTNNSTGQ